MDRKVEAKRENMMRARREGIRAFGGGDIRNEGPNRKSFQTTVETGLNVYVLIDFQRPE